MPPSQTRNLPSSLLLVLGLLAGAVACSKERGEPPECGQSRAKTRELLREDRLDEARQELEVAKRTCGQASAWEVKRLEGVLALEKRQQEAQRELEARETAREQEEPARAFMRWVRRTVPADKQRLGPAKCASRGDPTYGFCTLVEERRVGGPFVLSYLQSDPRIFRLEWQAPIALGCADLGPYRLGKRRLGGSARADTLCELTEHSLTGLQVLIFEEGATSRVVVFPERYLTADPALEQQVKALWKSP